MVLHVGSEINTETRILTTQSHYKDAKTFIKLSLFTAQYSCFLILRYFQPYFAACNFCAFTASGCSTPTLLRTLQHNNILVGLHFSMKIEPCNDLGHTNNTLLERHQYKKGTWQGMVTTVRALHKSQRNW